MYFHIVDGKETLLSGYTNSDIPGSHRDFFLARRFTWSGRKRPLNIKILQTVTEENPTQAAP